MAKSRYPTARIEAETIASSTGAMYGDSVPVDDEVLACFASIGASLTRATSAIVEDYFDMLEIELGGGGVVKAERNRMLQNVIDRSRGSIEYKHQNISAVMARWVAKEDGDGAGYDILSFSGRGDVLIVLIPVSDELVIRPTDLLCLPHTWPISSATATAGSRQQSLPSFQNRSTEARKADLTTLPCPWRTAASTKGNRNASC